MSALEKQYTDVAKKLAPAEFDVLTRAIQINNGPILLQASADVFNLIKDRIGGNELQEKQMQRSLVVRTELYGAALTRSHHTRVLIELIR